MQPLEDDIVKQVRLQWKCSARALLLLRRCAACCARLAWGERGPAARDAFATTLTLSAPPIYTDGGRHARDGRQLGADAADVRAAAAARVSARAATMAAAVMGSDRAAGRERWAESSGSAESRAAAGVQSGGQRAAQRSGERKLARPPPSLLCRGAPSRSNQTGQQNAIQIKHKTATRPAAATRSTSAAPTFA